MVRQCSIGRIACGTFLAAALATTLSACASAQPAASTPIPPKHPMPGSDRDAHGCIPSAGYAWCTRTKRCERPWELARENGFENSGEAFDRFCAATQDESPQDEDAVRK